MSDANDQTKFSIQKHEAIDFHYVLRLEVAEEVRSWAVPKGPSPDPRVKRLAIPVDEDIAIDFEGVIAGQGSEDKVIVWDSGPYEPVELDGQQISATEGLEEGKFDFVLHGQKLQGGFTLLRIDGGSNERWLLFKTPDAKATSRRNPVVTEPLSVLSGRDIKDVED